MRTELEQRPPRPIVRRVTAGLILVAAAALAIWAIVGVIHAIFGILVVGVAVVAVLWALKTLVW